MSEVQSGRPSGPRGRGSARGGRGGYSARGGRGGNRNTKSDSQENVHPPSFEDEGEIGELKKKYLDKISTVKELFPDWTDEDIVFALESTDGDLEGTIERITDGTVSQWGEVKKKSDRSRSKVKDPSTSQTDSSSAPGRGGRGRGGFEGRGRGRGDRGRSARGGRGASQANGTRISDKHPPSNIGDTWDTPSVPVLGGWDSAEAGGHVDSPAGSSDHPTNGEATGDSGWGSSDVVKEEPPAPVKDALKEQPKSSIIPEGSKKSWASMFAKPPPPPVVKKVTPPEPEKPIEQPVAIEEPTVEAPLPVPAELEQIEEHPIPSPQAPPPDLAITLAPSEDELTETNLEQLPDTSVPPASATAASTVASTPEPHSLLNSATTLSRSGISGFAATAYKAAGGTGRPSNFQRRVMEQQEAVVMPDTNHAVDRAAVQFGSMGLNGSAEELDVDDEREEAETRAQPPQHSPNAPRASLPPAPPPTQGPSEPAPTQVTRPAPGLPPVPQQSSPPQQASQAGIQYNQFSRYGEAAPKSYDIFGGPPSQPQQPIPNQDSYPTQPQAQPQPPASSAPSEYSSFYTSEQRNQYQNYYGGYGQQSQESGANQPRTGSAFGTTGPEIQSQYASSQPQTRYGQLEAQNSGQNTPNPTLPSHQPQPSQHMPQGQQAGYPYSHPYYSNPGYYASYMNQMNQQHQYGRNRPMYDDARRYDEHYMQHNNQFAYGAGQTYSGPYGKTGMYTQPQQNYGSYDHSSSPANAGSYNQQAIPGRDGAYGRMGSTQPEPQQATGAAAYANVSEAFGRSSSGYGQQQPLTQQHNGQQGGSDDAPKGYEQKAAGPSPSLGQAANRPGSANNMPGQPQAQSGLPIPQSGQGNQQQGFGGYPSHLGPQYSGSLGGLGGHQGAGGQNHHQSSGYGNYGAGAGFGYSYGTSSRGGWGGSYGH